MPIPRWEHDRQDAYPTVGARQAGCLSHGVIEFDVHALVIFTDKARAATKKLGTVMPTFVKLAAAEWAE